MTGKASRRTIFYQGMRDGIPIALGYFAVSFTLGIQAKKVGISVFWATVMSLTNNTSAGEFAAMTLIGVGAPYLEMAVTQLVVNIRYLLMSCALSQKLDAKTPFFHRFILAFDVTDEIFGISIAYNGKLDPFYTYGAMLVSIPGWALGTCLGVIFGNILPAGVVSALSVALYGMFLAIIIPPAKKEKTIALVVVISMLCSYLFSILPVVKELSSGIRIIILTVALALLAAVLFPVSEATLSGETDEKSSDSEVLSHGK